MDKHSIHFYRAFTIVVALFFFITCAGKTKPWKFNDIHSLDVRVLDTQEWLLKTKKNLQNLNKIINKQNGIDIISSYKRASNILESELKKDKIELSNTTDPGIFKTELEKNLFKKINELKKYFSSINNDENFVQTLDNLASIKREVFDFFDNVIVNEEDLVIKKNRLELIQMMCKTFDNYVNFSLIESN